MSAARFDMRLSRTIQPETLDFLAEDDPRAIRSRADLRRINRIMGTRAIMLRALRKTTAPRRVVELGAGDGTLMLGLARRLANEWPQVHLTLLDRQNLVTPGTIREFHVLGWHPEIVNEDVLDWASGAAADRYDLVSANLFLHHFNDGQLRSLLRNLAECTDAVFACEPRRAWLPLAASRLVGLIGANAVTREDAVLSVHAGFSGAELTALWPDQDREWQLQEYAAGLFSHCFLAMRQASR
jgi:hypothetical protein